MAVLSNCFPKLYQVLDIDNTDMKKTCGYLFSYKLSFG